jgi:hypothetical protein
MNDTDIGVLAFGLQVAFRSACEGVARPEITSMRIIGKRSSESDQGVVQHWAVVRQPGYRLRWRDRQGAEHITKKKRWNNAEAPGSNELEKQVE